MSLIPLNTALLERLRSIKLREVTRNQKKKPKAEGPFRKPPAIGWLSASKETVISSLRCEIQRGGANAPSPMHPILSDTFVLKH